MDVTGAVGGVAGLLTTIAFVPQVVKTWRTRRAEDFSLRMLILFTTGVALWMVYGVMLGALPILVPNVVTFVLSAYLLVVKVRWG